MFDEGLSLFAGLNVIPKRSFLTEYSCRIEPGSYPKLMRLWFDAMKPLGLDRGDSFDLDFHTIPFHGEDALVEKHYVSKRSRRQKGILAFLAQDASNRVFCYANVLIDVAVGDLTFGTLSARCLQSRLRRGLLICPVTYVEIGPVFGADPDAQDDFLENAGIEFREPWTTEDTKRAHQWWSQHIGKRRQKKDQRRRVADVLIGAYASRFDGLITRNPVDFRGLCPGLELLQPT